MAPTAERRIGKESSPRAEKLALDHMPRHGARVIDILHLAFALQLGAKEVLSFDQNQRGAAKAEGLAVSP